LPGAAVAEGDATGETEEKEQGFLAVGRQGAPGDHFSIPLCIGIMLGIKEF